MIGSDHILTRKAAALANTDQHTLDLIDRERVLERINQKHLGNVGARVLFALDGADQAALGIVIDHRFGQSALTVTVRRSSVLFGHKA